MITVLSRLLQVMLSKGAFSDALASLDLKLSVSQSVSHLPFFKLSVIPVIPVIRANQAN